MAAKQKTNRQKIIDKKDEKAKNIKVGLIIVLLFIELLLLMVGFWLLSLCTFTDASDYHPFVVSLFLPGATLWALLPSTIIALIASRKKRGEEHTKKMCIVFLISVFAHILLFFLIMTVGKKDLSFRF